MRLLSITLFTMVLSSAVTLFWPLGGAATSNPPAPLLERRSSGSEQPREGCLFQNGWNVCDYGLATIRDTYLRYADLTGEPLSSFDSQCQTFRFASLCFKPGNPDGWKVEFANLGLQDLTANGFTPQPGVEIHAALRDWIQAQLELGVDVPRVVGRVLSPPICSRESGSCRVWTDKTAFSFPADAVSGSQVQRLALGLTSLPAPVPPPVTSPGPSWPLSASIPLLAVLVMAVVLTVTLLTRKTGAGSPPSTI